MVSFITHFTRINHRLLSNWFYVLYSLGFFLLIFLYILLIKKGFDISDEGFYLAKINGNIIHGAESVPFDEIISLYAGQNLDRVLFFRLINILLLTSSAAFFSFAFTKLVLVNNAFIVKFSYYVASVASVLFFLNYYPNNISYNTLNVTFLLLTLGAFILFHKSQTKYRFLFLSMAAFFLSHLFFIKLPTFILIFFCMSFLILLSDRKIAAILLFTLVSVFVVLLLKATNFNLQQYIHKLFSSGMDGSHSYQFMLALLYSYINNYFLVTFLAGAILIFFKLLTYFKQLVPASKILIFYIFYFFIMLYFVYFFFNYFELLGFEFVIYLVLSVLGLLCYFQSISVKIVENQTIEGYLLLIINRLKNNPTDILLVVGILLTPIIAAIGTNNIFQFAVLPYFVFIAIPVLAIAHQSRVFHFTKFFLFSLLIFLMYKGLIYGFITHPYALRLQESKLTKGINYSKSINLKDLEIGPNLAQQIQFVDSVFTTNEYHKGDTIVTFNFCDGIPYILEAKILYSPICDENSFDFYYSEVNKYLIGIKKLYIIDNAKSNLLDPTILLKLGIEPKNINKIGGNSEFTLFIYKSAN